MEVMEDKLHTKSNWRLDESEWSAKVHEHFTEKEMWMIRGTENALIPTGNTTTISLSTSLWFIHYVKQPIYVRIYTVHVRYVHYFKNIDFVLF